MSSKKPPDKYRTIKCSLKSISKNELNQTKLIVNTYLLNKTRPEKFRRDYKFPETIKDDNPIIIGINNSVKCH